MVLLYRCCIFRQICSSHVNLNQLRDARLAGALWELFLLHDDNFLREHGWPRFWCWVTSPKERVMQRFKACYCFITAGKATGKNTLSWRYSIWAGSFKKAAKQFGRPNVFKFCIRNKTEFPGSPRLARCVMRIPATCASSETDFSLSGRICE